MNLKQLQNYFDKNTFLFNGILYEFEKEKNSKFFPIANEVLLDYSKNLSFIIDSMLKNAKDGNLYSISILYRSMIEHFFKAFYVFAKTLGEKSDETAEKLQKHYFISEVLAEQAGFIEMDNIKFSDKSKKDFLEYLIEKIPSLSGFDKENQREISAAIKQFGLKEIIKFFHSSLSKSNKILNSDIIIQMIPEYSKFSSFTHGGPYASSQFKFHKDKESVNSEIERIIEISIVSYIIINQSVVLTYQPGEYLGKILKMMQEMR